MILAALALGVTLAGQNLDVCAVNVRALARIEAGDNPQVEARKLVLERVWPRASIDRALRAYQHGIASYEIRCIDDDQPNPYGEDE